MVQCPVKHDVLYEIRQQILHLKIAIVEIDRNIKYRRGRVDQRRLFHKSPELCRLIMVPGDQKKSRSHEKERHRHARGNARQNEIRRVRQIRERRCVDRYDQQCRRQPEEIDPCITLVTTAPVFNPHHDPLCTNSVLFRSFVSR